MYKCEGNNTCVAALGDITLNYQDGFKSYGHFNKQLLVLVAVKSGVGRIVKGRYCFEL